jgi:hypothetical protein
MNMYRKYYSYNDMPVPIKKETERGGDKEQIKCADSEKPCAEPCEKPCTGGGGFLENLAADDIILIAVIAALLLDGCDDKLLLAAIAFVLLTGK